MSNSKDSDDFDGMEEDSTLNRLNEISDEDLGLDESDEIDLNDLDSEFEDQEIDTNLDPKEFLEEFGVDEEPHEQTDLNEMLRDLESNSEFAEEADDFDEELIELTRDHILEGEEAEELDAAGEQEEFSFVEQNALLEEKDAPDQAEEDMDQLLSEMEEQEVDSDTPEEEEEPYAEAEPEPEDDAFQRMDEFDEEGETLDELPEEDVELTAEEEAELEEIDDDQLVDALEHASFSDMSADAEEDVDIPDSDFSNSVMNAEEESVDEVSDFGDDLYAQQEEPLEEDEEELLETLDDEIPQSQRFTGIEEELPETDEENLPNHVSEHLAGEDYSEFATDNDASTDYPIESDGSEMEAEEEELELDAPMAASRHEPTPPPPGPAAPSSASRSNLALAGLAVVVALGGVAGFWHSTQIGSDVESLKKDLSLLREQALKGEGDQGVGRRDVEQLRDNLFALERRVGKPIKELRTAVNQQLDETSERVTRLERQTQEIDRRLQPGMNAGSGTAALSSAPQGVDYGPRLTRIEGTIQKMQKEVLALRDAIVSSTDPAETKKLKVQLMGLVQQVAELKQKLGTPGMQPAEQTPMVAATPPRVASPAPVKAAAAPEPAATPAPVRESQALPQEPMTAAAAAPATPAAEKPAAKGTWGINLRSYASLALARKGQQELADRDLEAVVREAEVSGKTWYRLRLEGFNSSREAKRYINGQLADAGFSGAWISRN